MPDRLALGVILGVDFLRLFKIIIDGSSLVVTGPAGLHTPWAI